MAAVASAAATPAHHHHLRQRSSTSISPTTTDDGSDLLHETLLATEDRSLAEDHLEDILSMPLSPELHSRRSHTKLSRSTTASNSSLGSAYDFGGRPPPLAPSAPTSPVTHGSKKSSNSRSASPEFGRPTAATRIPLSRSRSKSGGRELVGSDSSKASRRAVGTSAEAAAATEQWETLQIAPTLTSPRKIEPGVASSGAGRKSSSPASSGMARSRTAGSLPASSHAAALHFPPSPSNNHKVPPLPPSASNVTPRKRAQTSNLLGSGISPKPALPSHLSPTAPPPRSASGPLPTPATPSPTTTRRQLKPSSATSPPPATKKARRKSFSAATSYRIGEAGREVDAAAGGGGGVEPLPPWMDEGPRVFRTTNGKGEKLEKEGKWDEMVLPAVARRLESERLARLALRGGGEEEEEDLGLISSWGKDGLPRGTTHVKGPRSGTPSPAPGAMAMGAGELVEMRRFEGGHGVEEDGKRTGGELEAGGDDTGARAAEEEGGHPPPPPPPPAVAAPQQQPTQRPTAPSHTPKQQRPSRDPDPHGLARPVVAEVPREEQREGEKQRRSRRRAEEEERQHETGGEKAGCCAGCVIM